MTNTKNQKVTWQSYPDYPFIQANQFGEIRTVDRTVIDKNGKKRHYKGHILKQSDNGHSYLRVKTHVKGKMITLYVHRVVASCFLPNPDNLPEVNHKNNNPKDNSVSNLEWCTRQYNNAYKEKYGVSAKEATKVLRKPLFAVNLKTSEVLHFESQRGAARQLGVDQASLWRVLKGHRKQTGGFWFCYADSEAVEKARAKFGNKVASKVERLLSSKS